MIFFLFLTTESRAVSFITVQFQRLGWIILFFWCVPSFGVTDPLPYSVRTHPYDGWNTSVHGDNRTIGMGGAVVGLGDTFLASLENPSGLAMAFEGIDLNFANNDIQDGYLQNYQNPTYLGSVGIAANIYPWGFSLGFLKSYREEQNYFLPLAPEQSTHLETSISEFRVGAARLIDLKDSTLALGIGLNLGTSTESINYSPQNSTALGFLASGMLQLPNRILLGLSYQLPMTYPAPSDANSSLLPGFYQQIEVPSRLALGLGWIPNRVFRGGLSLSYVGVTQNAALLRDDQLFVGSYSSFQPRLGFAYTFADFSIFQSRVYVGTYIEDFRSGSSNRVHFTSALDTSLWFVTLGYSGDVSYKFTNHSVSIGVDVIKIATMLELIPKPWHPPYEGLFAEPFRSSDTGLARPLVKNWVQHGEPLNLIQVGLALPAIVEKKLEVLKTEIRSLNLREGKKEDEPEAPKPAHHKHKKKKHKKKKIKAPNEP